MSKVFYVKPTFWGEPEIIEVKRIASTQNPTDSLEENKYLVEFPDGHKETVLESELFYEI